MLAAFIGAIFAAGLAGSADAQSVVLVRADNQPLWGDPAPLRRELRLGVLDGREEQSFGRIVGIAVSRDGQLWIADAQASTIRRFDVNGTYLGSVGRNGEGPGEFRNLAGLQRTPDGRVAAWDSRLKRVSFFDDAGECIETVRVPAQYEVRSSLESFRVGARGEVLWQPKLGYPLQRRSICCRCKVAVHWLRRLPYAVDGPTQQWNILMPGSRGWALGH